MAFELTMISLELVGSKAVVVFQDKENGGQVQLIVTVKSSGDSSESQLRQSAREAARQALQGALSAL